MEVWRRQSCYLGRQFLSECEAIVILRIQEWPLLGRPKKEVNTCSIITDDSYFDLCSILQSERRDPHQVELTVLVMLVRDRSRE